MSGGDAPNAGDVYVCSVRSMLCGPSITNSREDAGVNPSSLDLPSSFTAAF